MELTSTHHETVNVFYLGKYASYYQLVRDYGGQGRSKIDLPIGNEFYASSKTYIDFSPPNTEERRKKYDGFYKEPQISRQLLASIIPQDDLFLFLSILFCESLLSQILHHENLRQECIAPDGRTILQLNWGLQYNPDPIAIFELHDAVLCEISEKSMQREEIGGIFDRAANCVLTYFKDPAALLSQQETADNGAENNISVCNEAIRKLDDTMYHFETQGLITPQAKRKLTEDLVRVKNNFGDILYEIQRRSEHRRHISGGFVGLNDEERQTVSNIFWNHCNRANNYLKHLPALDD